MSFTGAFDVMRRLPEKVPVAAGAKETLKTFDWRGPIVAGAGGEIPKGAATVNAERTRSAEPEFVSVRERKVDRPCGANPKAMLASLVSSAPEVPPMPVRPTGGIARAGRVSIAI
jgi:hypothetical protein